MWFLIKLPHTHGLLTFIISHIILSAGPLSAEVIEKLAILSEERLFIAAITL